METWPLIEVDAIDYVSFQVLRSHILKDISRM